MGITKPVEEYEKHVLNSLGWKYRGLKWCEFGNQGSYRNKIAKKIYEERGVLHTSMDLNGRDGALPIDLGQPVPSIYVNQFDVVTNYGTIEHINNQFETFKNVHDMCKEGGIMIHVFPLLGNWLKHCRYHYSEKFVTKLASVCDYCVIKHTILDELDYQMRKNMIAITYIKKKNSRFVTREEFSRIEGIVDSGDCRKTRNYTTKGRIKINRLYDKIEPNFPFIKIFKKLYHIAFSKGSKWNGEYALQIIESAKKNFPSMENINLTPYQKYELIYWIENGIKRKGREGNKMELGEYLDKISSIYELPENPEHAMDVGCGPYGGVSLVYNAKHWTLVDVLNNVYKDMVKRDPRFIYLACAGEDVSVTDNSFDVIFSTNALDHTEDRMKCENEIYRTLKPDGIFALVVHCRTKEQLNEGHKQVFTPELLLKEFSSIGFSPINYIIYQTKFKTFAGVFKK